MPAMRKAISRLLSQHQELVRALVSALMVREPDGRVTLRELRSAEIERIITDYAKHRSFLRDLVGRTARLRVDTVNNFSRTPYDITQPKVGWARRLWRYVTGQTMSYHWMRGGGQ